MLSLDAGVIHVSIFLWLSGSETLSDKISLNEGQGAY